MTKAKPKSVRFEAVKLSAAEPGWFVRITLPHGEQIHISDFNAETEARNWIADKSEAWLKKYRGGRYV
jgi:NAD(P)H-flavin reductase